MGHQGVGWTDDPRSNPLELPTPQDDGNIVYYKRKLGDPQEHLIWESDTCATCGGLTEKKFTISDARPCFSFSLLQGEFIESPKGHYRYHARQQNQACLFSSTPKSCL